MTERQIRCVGIVGAGVMGSGIMINAAMRGFDVLLCDRSPDARHVALQRLETYLARQIEKGRTDDAASQAVRRRVTLAENISDLSRADLVIEAVFERLDLKRQVFAEIEKAVSTKTIVSSNTSCLRLSDIAAALEKPERFCGMHYFSPAEVNPVVELIEGPGTTDEVLSAARAFLESCSKTVIACRDQNGFALNRFFCPYSNEAVRLMDEGYATPGQIDQIARETFGLALGPFAVMNIIGTGTNLNAVRNLEPLGPFYLAADGLITQGQTNTPWEIDSPKGVPNEEMRVAVTERLTASILLPVLEALGEETATLDAIDTGARMAFRFEKTPGTLIQTLGATTIHRLVRTLAGNHGHDPAKIDSAHLSYMDQEPK